MFLSPPPASFLHHALSLLFPALCAALLLLAAARDFASRTIPNSIPLALAVLGSALQLNDGTMPMALLAASLVFIICTLAWRTGLMGGGDVKLLSALAVCVPPAAVLSLVTAVGLAGGVLGLVYIVLRRITPAPPIAIPAPLPLRLRVLRAERWRIGRGSPLPYGIAIAVGGLVTLF